MNEGDDAFGASCSNRTVFVHLSGCSSFAVSDPLANVDVSHYVLFVDLSPSPDATHVDPASAPPSRDP